ncbi:MAG: acylphosphatase [Candidatus Hydrothermarchaeota archaeon]
MELGLKGYVENLRDRPKVKIVVEGEKEKIDEFINKIKIKDEFTNVEDIEVEYKEYTGEFEYFDIKYGSLEEEIGDRMVTGIDYIKGLTSVVKIKKE